MNANQMKTACYAILSTLHDCGGSSPASTIYLAMGMNIGDYEAVKNVLVRMGMVTVSSASVIKLTPAGADCGAKISAILAESKATA